MMQIVPIILFETDRESINSHISLDLFVKFALKDIYQASVGFAMQYEIV